MTNETIRPGDLVMVVRPTVCCGVGTSIGKVFSVKAIAKEDGVCKYCGRLLSLRLLAFTGNGRDAVLLSRLKKLNPPAKHQTTEKEKEMA